MKSADNNPESNRLIAALEEEKITDAVRKSGYPLQTLIADSLRTRQFVVQEEWSFIDSDTKSLRSLDLQAHMELSKSQKGCHVRPALNLLIECKQSDLPYVFFVSGDNSPIRTFPVIAGVFNDTINITTDDSKASWNYSVLGALGMNLQPFLSAGPVRSMSFSKCVRKGKEVELSGTEAFQNLVLPSVKALRHFKLHEAPPKTASYFDCHLALAVGVLDAPMIAAKVDDGSGSLTLTPWIRVVRHEAVESEHWFDRLHSYAIDVVHKDFFDTYLSEHVLPFSQMFSELAVKHEREIADGKAFASGLKKTRGRDNIEPVLQPRPNR